MIRRAWLHTRNHVHIWAIFVLSYGPLFLTQHGKLNADTKLYLTEDPVGLISRSVFAWDSSQFGGFVPHQAIAYLWPSGPFHLFFSALGMPQWVTQRLWLGTLFFLAGTGVYAFLRWLASSALASLVASVVFMFSPYVLSYQSRTSTMLLPWAGIGWLCYFTARGIRERSWLWPSLIALTMFTIGAVNATATLLIVPAPILVALHFLPTHNPIRSLIVFSLRTTSLVVGTSLWWIVMVSLQSRYGAELLAYSETLESVSSTANAFEVLRGFGYWLNYVDLDSLPLTTATQKILTSPLALLATVLLPLLAIGALNIVRAQHRRLGMWLILVGTVLAVGVYPLDDAFPIFQPLANRPTSSVSLAFRSSTRAIPVMLVGLAIGIATLIDAPAFRRQIQLRKPAGTRPFFSANVIVSGLLIGLALLAFPTKFTNGAYDPSLGRTPIPESWKVLGDKFENPDSSQARIVQLPGQEFGAYTWGYTSDPALPAVTNRGLLTRDLIPLGNESMMNLLWALDEAAQQGRLTPQSLSPIGRALSSDTFFFPSDLDTQRYNTITQDNVLQANALNAVAQTATSEADGHEYISIEDASMFRQHLATTLLLGDGKGLIDAAISNVLENETILYAGHLNDQQLRDYSDRITHAIITDSNTERAQHWRTSVDTYGFDENLDGSLSNFARDSGDVRMNVFPERRSSDITWFEQVGPVRARASSYGPPLSYRPELRPYAAIDNNPATAWTVAHGVEPLSPVLEILTDSPVETITVLQPLGNPNRRITKMSVSVDGGTWFGVQLADDSLQNGQLVQLDIPGTVIALRIDEIQSTRALNTGEEQSGVGFAEVKTGLGATREVGYLPTRGLDLIDSDTILTYVMSRRIAPVNRDTRSDVETTWSRSFEVLRKDSFSIRARIDTTSMNDIERNITQKILESEPIIFLDDTPLAFTAQFDSEQQEILALSSPIELNEGTHRLETISPTVLIDQVIVQSQTPGPTTMSPHATLTKSSLVKKTLLLEPCPTGCWFVFGEGHNREWKATVNGKELVDPIIVNGGSNGWWLEPFTTEQHITLEFTPQKTLSRALLATGLCVLVCLILVFRSRRDWRTALDTRDEIWDIRGTVPTMATFIVVFATLIALLPPFTATLCIAVVIAACWQRVRIIAIGLTTAVLIVAMTSSWWEIIFTDPTLTFDWTSTTAGSHRTIVSALAVLAAITALPQKPTHRARHNN